MFYTIQILMVTFLIEVGWSQTTSEPSQIKPGYKFEYYVKDERTGDFKTQEEKREGDYITGSYSVGEPNGDLRVVTYNAGQNTGFNAHVQIHPGGSPVNSNIMEKQKHLEEIMKIIPKYQLKTGFPQFDIKVIPPILSSTTTKTTTITTEINDEQTENKKKVILNESTNNQDNITKIDEENKNETQKTEYDDDNKKKEKIISTTESLEKCTELCDGTSDKAEEEGRAHIKPNEDKVQVEMEQIIRAEMQDPTSVNLGVPYQKHETIDEQGNTKFIIKPLNIDYKPLINEEEIMEVSDSIKGTNQNSAITPAGQTPYLFERNVFMYPYTGDNTWSRISGVRYPDVSRAMFAQSFELRKTPKPSTYSQPLYTTGLAFIVLPRQ